MHEKFKMDNRVEPTDDEIVQLRKQASEIADQLIGASVPGRGHCTDIAQHHRPNSDSCKSQMNQASSSGE